MHEASQHFVTLSIIWTCLSLFVLSAVFLTLAWKRRRFWPNRKDEGAFGHGHWALRGSVSLLLVLLGLVPAVVLITCVVLGPMVAALEGWPVAIGVEYMISNALGLLQPLTEETPVTLLGQLVSSIANCLSMVVVTATMGIVSSMMVVSEFTQRMPKSAKGFFLTMFILIPTVMFLLAFFTGLLMAASEGWSVRQGFFYMIGALLGLANPLTSVAPLTPASLLIECICISIELALAGAILGIAASHPLTQKFQALIEGERMQIQVDEVDVEKGAEPSDPSTEANVEQDANPAYLEVSVETARSASQSPEASAPEVSADHDVEAEVLGPSAPSNPIRKPQKRSIQQGSSKASRKAQRKAASVARGLGGG